jgi:hypothetical protein
MTHSARTHATLAPSAASRWMRCPGSVALSQGVEDTSSSYANEGTAAHMLAERCLSGGSEAATWRGWIIDTAAKFGNDPFYRPDYPGGKANGTTKFEVDAEMVEGVQLYLDVAREVAEESEEFEIEQRLDMSGLVPGVFGTGDAVGYRAVPTRRITVVDLKYGRGIAVDVEENEQELTYAAGLAQRYHNRGVDEIELVIVQPRAIHRDGPVRRWVTDMVGLYEHIMQMQSAAEEAAEPDAPLNPGSWCKFCKAAAFCPALRDKVYAAIGAQLIGGDIFQMSDPAKFTPEQLAEARRNMPMVANWLKSVDHFSHAEALRGRMPPGFKWVAKRSNRQWLNEDDAANTLGMYGLDDAELYEPKALRSPAQVEKLLPAKERKVVEALSVKPPAGVALAPVDDPRPAVNPDADSGFEATEIAG